MLKAWSEEVAAPESTRALMAGRPIPGSEHHSSLPTMSLLVKAAEGPFREKEKTLRRLIPRLPTAVDQLRF